MVDYAKVNSTVFTEVKKRGNSVVYIVKYLKDYS